MPNRTVLYRCGDRAFNQPLDLISTVMVFRGLYNFFEAVLRGDASDAVPYFIERQKLFGLVKTRRKRQSVG